MTAKELLLFDNIYFATENRSAKKRTFSINKMAELYSLHDNLVAFSILASYYHRHSFVRDAFTR